jgi:hypothetical protein
LPRWGFFLHGRPRFDHWPAVPLRQASSRQLSTKGLGRWTGRVSRRLWPGSRRSRPFSRGAERGSAKADAQMSRACQDFNECPLTRNCARSPGDHIRPDPLAHIRALSNRRPGLRAEPKYHLPRGSRNPTEPTTQLLTRSPRRRAQAASAALRGRWPWRS